MKRALVNGNIHCLDENQRVVQAILMDGNRIAAVGTNEEIAAMLEAEETAEASENH
ncbi:hypothetical protein ACPW7J_10315 [Ihubacter sp. rT4E-8]|uniref:hypothetical protein n=1 Tax=Ihubacter sp. rT4E-8 TaxID=3242369 RepID=UPI003CED18F3